MNEFEEFKSKWETQDLGQLPNFDKSNIESNLLKFRKEKYWTPLILLLTIVILLFFLMIQPEESFHLLKKGIILMSVSLFVRVLFELWSNSMLNRLELREAVSLFYAKLTKFERTRRTIHFIITPIVLIVYILAFYSLLPAFKLNLSVGMYNYVLWSSVVVFTTLIVFKFISIPRELKLIKHLKGQINESNFLNE